MRAAVTFERIFQIILLACVALFLNACGKVDGDTKTPKKLRVLAWVGYDEVDFLTHIEKELGAKIAVKTYVGGDQMYSLFRSAPLDTYDVVVVDAEYGKRMFIEGSLYPLGEELWGGQGLFRPFSTGEPARDGESVYGAVVRWGALGLVYNRTKLSAKQAADYKTLWDPALAGRIGIFDWYLPNMGVLSRYLGNNSPYNLSAEKLSQLRRELLRLRPLVRAIHQNTGDVIADLKNEEVFVTPGIGEWAAAVLAEEGKPIDWTIPKQGGVMWVETLAIPIASKNRELAKRFITLVRQPEHSARLAWRKAYHSQVPGRDAYKFLSAEQRKLLKAENLDSLQELIDRLSIRQLPGPSTGEADWVRVWTEFKAGVKQ